MTSPNSGDIQSKKAWRRKVVDRANRYATYGYPLKYRQWQRAIFRLRQHGIALPQARKL